MNLETNVEHPLYELLPLDGTKIKDALVFKKKRIYIGRSETCDIVLPFPDVTAIHAVLELSGTKGRLYDMNSTNGTFVNGKKSILHEFTLGDTLQFSLHKFVIKKYVKEDVPPPILDMLDPALPPIIPSHKVLPKAAPVISSSDMIEDVEDVEVPFVAYPLGRDPKAEFSEYIFEDVETLYPIFKYEVEHAAVEVVILYKDKIYSVDYLPLKDGSYKLQGSFLKNNQIEYPYLPAKDLIDFIEIKGREASVHPIPGHEVFTLSDDEQKKEEQYYTLQLSHDDIIRFSRGDVQIFVRLSEHPPKVKRAPILRRDKELKNYLFLVFTLVFLFLFSMTIFKVDPDLDKEKDPERVASILYKAKPKVSKNKAIEQTKLAPKEVAQKSPQQKEPAKEVKLTEKTEPTPQKKPAPVPKKVEGEKVVAKVEPPKKAPPKPAPVTKPRPRVTETIKQGGASAAPSQVSRRAVKVAKAQGHVDTYKAFNFKSSISSLLAKGGAIQNLETEAAQTSDVGLSGLEGGEESATLEKAKVSQKIGSLTGAASGTLDTTKGVEGLVSKKSIYTAGLPYKTVVLGGMDPDTIRRILIDHIPQFRTCYQRVLDQATAEYQGVVRLDFVIGASGNVTKAAVDSADSSLPGTVKACVVNVLKGIQFPEPLGGGVVEVRQPFNFYPRRK